MKIFDEDKKIIENPDLGKGHLVYCERPIVHRYKVTVEEKGHYETVKEYPNGGKDVKWVVDEEEQGVWKTYDTEGNEIETDRIVPDDAPHEDELSDIEGYYKYVLFTEDELKERLENEVKDQINELKQMLADTDYIVIKVAEGMATWDEYPEIKEQRQTWRNEINKLESTIE